MDTRQKTHTINHEPSMTHMRFRSSHLCCSTMQFNLSASIFHRGSDIRNPASEKILSAEALAILMVPTRRQTVDNNSKFFRLGAQKEKGSSIQSFNCVIILVLLKETSNTFTFCELLGEVHFAGVQRVVWKTFIFLMVLILVCTSSKLRLSFLDH